MSMMYNSLNSSSKLVEREEVSGRSEFHAVIGQGKRTLELQRATLDWDNNGSVMYSSTRIVE